MDTSVYFAPLQSYTTIPYFLAFNQVVGGINKYFTPFYRAEKNGFFDLDNELRHYDDICIIPQVLCNSGNELIQFAQQCADRGFEEINLNMGCPFPMVVNKKLGSGILPFPDMVKKMLDDYFMQNSSIKLSVKLRLGLQSTLEMESIIKLLKTYPLKEIIMHPRLGVQKYKGSPDWNIYEELTDNYPMVANGDILSLDDIQSLKNRFPGLHTFMIGRGLLMNPCLLKPELDWYQTMNHLHDNFFSNLQNMGLSQHQILNQLKCFWEYPSLRVENGKRILRKMKKAGKLDELFQLKSQLLNQDLA